MCREQEEVLTRCCAEIFASGAETEEFFYRLGIKEDREKDALLEDATITMEQRDLERSMQ